MTPKNSVLNGLEFDFKSIQDEELKLQISLLLLGGVVVSLARKGVELPRLQGVISLNNAGGGQTKGSPKTLYAPPGTEGQDAALSVLVDILRAKDKPVPPSLRDFLADHLDPSSQIQRKLVFEYRQKAPGKKLVRPSPEADRVVAAYVDHVMQERGLKITEARAVVAGWFGLSDASAIGPTQRRAPKGSEE